MGNNAGSQSTSTTNSFARSASALALNNNNSGAQSGSGGSTIGMHSSVGSQGIRRHQCNKNFNKNSKLI